MMNTQLSIRASNLSNEELQNLTYDLCRTLTREAGLNAAVMETPSKSGSKGPGLDLGTIVLTLISSGGVAVTLINVLNTYLNRNNHIEVELTAKDGTTVKLAGENLRPDQLERTTELIQRLLGAGG